MCDSWPVPPEVPAADWEIVRMIRGKTRKGVVMVVDDEALIRWSLSEALTDAGYTVQLAESGAEARTLLAATGGEPLVIVLDMLLSDVRDLSFMREVRASRPEVAVIMMTAYGTPEDAAAALEAGVFRFVHKPFDMTELIEMVGDALARRERPDP
jgi:two-component system nitrogen regulation response regulator GlnG